MLTRTYSLGHTLITDIILAVFFSIGFVMTLIVGIACFRGYVAFVLQVLLVLVEIIHGNTPEGHILVTQDSRNDDEDE
jgi:general stress protein CsbA